ncbi:ABC transporter ATP-binding protein [Frigidibacter sp. ROC022]|uniref:ABC transporter ATP-binding protein n=1 Tax=Frigidibacter sp. ROC022 TaxID=2971796 RepID=UPI00215A942D|nr:ABC transporter ATP-binding protein [Frigidibacter sp. ROC022]MCR8726429.1 ABC transporter ATP-binding protein [Frigidibacter sp. ROC022]
MGTSISVRDLVLSFGSVQVLKKLNLEVADGEFIVLLGSSGCGKSTLLNCIAGLLDITDGQIWIKEKNVTWAEPKDRGIGMVFQSYALYPQMTVRGNLSFGLKNQRLPKAEIDKRIARAADVLQIEALLDRKPGALSGGQRQRVAIGRALVRDVDVFLFDEPLSNLDAKLRADLRVELKRLHNQLENTMIYVTHDQVEAMTLADRIAIMRGGQIMQFASPKEIYSRPANRYVADFIGSPAMNFVEGTVADGAFTCAGHSIPLDGYEFTPTGRAGGPAWFGIRPEHIQTGEQAEAMPFRTEVEVDLCEPMGAETQVWASFADMQFRFLVDFALDLKRGDKVSVGFDPARASLFHKGNEERM